MSRSEVSLILEKLEHGKNQLIFNNESESIPGIAWIVPAISKAEMKLIEQDNELFTLSMAKQMDEDQIEIMKDYIRKLETAIEPILKNGLNAQRKLYVLNLINSKEFES